METVIRALKVLKSLANKPLSVQEVADVMEVHKSTASRLLSSLKKEKFVHLNSNGKYQLGYAIFELSHAWSSNQDVISISAPYLKMLNKETNETIHLAILDEWQIVYINKIDSSKAIKMNSTIGKRAPAYCTGIGKAILAFNSKDQKKTTIKKTEFIRYTDNTITDENKLNSNLDKVVEDGIAWDLGEHEEEIICIAAPIFDRSNEVIAGISISATKVYTSEEVMRSYKGLLLSTCKDISKLLGYTGHWPPKIIDK